MILSPSTSNNKKKEYFFYIDLMKFIGVCLIINSHLDPIYPIKALATGGALGNSLFFAASGFLIRDKKKDINFFLKFLMRIYIPLIIVSGIYGINHQKSYFAQLIWPTNYWFIGAIVLFYFLYALLEKFNVFAHITQFMAIMTVFYFAIYIFALDTSKWVVETPGLNNLNSCFKLIYYFAIMVFAGYIKGCTFNKKIISNCKLMCITSIIIMYISKAIMAKYLFFMHFQFISQLCAFAFGVSFLIICKNSIYISKLNSKLVKYVSSISLECYLTQFKIIDMASSINFPISLFTIILGILVSASLLNKITNIIIRITWKIGGQINDKIL